LKAFARFLSLFAEGKRALGFSQTASSGMYAWISVGCPLFSLVKMPRGKVQFVPRKEVFSEWREVVKDYQGFALLVRSGKLRIEVLKKIDESCSGRVIFLGELKRPTMRVGFLNALFWSGGFEKKIDLGGLENILIPLPSRLRINQIEKNFRILEKLKSLDRVINLEILQIINN